MQASRSFVFAAAVAVGLAFISSAADTWYWLGKVTCKDAKTGDYGYAFNSSENWQNVDTGASGIPKDGDSVIFRTGKQPFGSDFNTEVGFASLEFEGLPTGQISNQGTFTLMTGGKGIVTGANNAFTTAKFHNGNVAVNGDGELVVDIANGTYYIQKSFYSTSGKATLVKRGAGILQNSEGYAPPDSGATYNETRDQTNNYYANRKFVWKAVKIQEGTLDLRQYYWVRDIDFQFDGNGVILDVKKLSKERGIHSLELSNCKIRETERVTTTSHRIRGQTADCYIHMFGDKMEDLSFSGEFSSYAGLVWEPTDSTKTFTFRKTVSPTAGILTVKNGTIRITEGAGFPNVPTITVSGAAAKLQIDASAQHSYSAATLVVENGGKVSCGGRIVVKAASVNGAPVVDGVYSSKSGEFRAQADWVEGDGCVVVGNPESAAVAATWNGTGNATTLANWNGAAELPALNDGSAQVTVAGGSSFVADTDVWVKGFTLGVSPFTFSAADGKELWIGSAGISAAGKAVTVGAADGCVVAAGAQTWNIGAGSLAVNGDVGSVGDDALWIKGANKNALDLNAATPSWTAPVFITNMVVNFKASGALGPTGAHPAYLFQAPTFAGGITVDRDLWIFTDPGITPTTAGDLTFNGFVCSTNKQGLSITAPANTRIVFNKLMMSRNGGTMKGAGTIVFNDSCHFRDRPSMQETVTVELHKDGNRLNGNMGTFSGGRLKAMKPYVITKANTRRQTADGAGSSSDSAANTMINSKSNFILDLNGFDQSIDQLAMHANGTSSGGHVTSATPATLHLQTEKSWWPNHNYTYGFSDYYNSADPDKTRSKADSYGYETADKGYWEGGVTLSYEAATGMVRSMMRESSSTGNVEVVSGTLVFLRRAKTTNETFDLKGGSANPYYRLANEDGAWPNASKAVVKGGVLKLEHGKAFGKETAFELNSDGKLQLEEGVRQSCASLTLNGEEAQIGTYGSTESDAQVKNDDYFTGKGVLKVGKIGGYILIR